MEVSVTGHYVSGPPTLNFLKQLEMSSPKCATKHIFLKLRLSFDILLSNLFIILSNELTTNKPFFQTLLRNKSWDCSENFETGINSNLKWNLN